MIHKLFMIHSWGLTVKSRFIGKGKIMQISEAKLGFFGIIVGTVALLIALVSFWGGPFAPQPTLEEAVAEKVLSLQNAAINALNGESIEDSYSQPKWDIDRVIDIIIPVVAVLSILMGVFSLIFKEPVQVAGCALALGFSAIAFQFIAMYAMALLFVLLVIAVFSSLGGG